MASFSINTAFSGAQTLNDGEIGVIGQNGFLSPSGLDAVTMSGVSTLNVFGVISPSGSADVGVFGDGDTLAVTVAEGAGVSANRTAITLDVSQTAQVRINGDVSSPLTGLAMRAEVGAAGVEGVITGQVQGGAAGVSLDTGAAGALLSNSGVIYGADAGVEVISGASVRLNNTGEIIGGVNAIRGADGSDQIANGGRLVNDVSLGAGDDVYTGARGVVIGAVDAGDGNDLLTGGANTDVFRGQGGADRLEGRGGGDRLEGGFGADHLMGQSGDDELRGDAGADQLRGGGGDDLAMGGLGDDMLRGGHGDDDLRGNGGADILNGGLGDDTLTGGAMGDRFEFYRNAGNDRIIGFENGLDLIDLTAFGLDPSDFGVIAGALSTARSATFLDLSDLGGQGSVLIKGLAFADADAGDFIF